MECGERPCCPCILVVDNDQGGDGIGEGEPTEDVDRNVRMVTAEVAEEKDEDPCRLNAPPQVREGIVNALRRAELIKGEAKSLSHASRELIDGKSWFDRAD